MRVQLALNVKDLDQAIEFYSRLFDAKVNKRKPGYANFAIEQPPLKLVLFENPEADERLNHLGVEVFEEADVRSATERLKAAGWSDDEIAFIHSPIGLDIGAETPEEMAVAILSEITQVRYGHGTGLSLRGTDGRIHRQRGDEPGTA